MPIINISKSKKGKNIITINFEDGKKMTAPPETNADESLNGKDVEVEREKGQIIKIIYDGKILFEKKSNDLKSNSNLQNTFTFDNQSNKMHMKHTGDIKNPARAPYNSIPLNKTVVKAPEPPDLNEYHDKRLTGWINLNIETKTPLYIRDTLSIEDIKNKKTSNDISNFYSPGGKIKIPGSSLRGMTRTMLEIVSYGKFDFFDDQPLYFRGLADKSNLRTEYQSKMTSYDIKNKKTQYKFNAGYLFTKGLNYFIKPAKFDKIPKTKSEAKIKKSGKSYTIFNYYKISQSECIVVSGDMHNKKNDWLIYAPEKNAIEIPVPEDDIISYHNDINRSKEVPNLIELSKTDEVPCFYVKWKDSSEKERISFGHTGMFRLAYEKTIADYIPENLRDTSKIDFAESIFGKKDKFPSRVFFEDANLCEGQGDDILMKESTPKILSSPKPTSFQHYLVQSSDNIRSLNHYNSNTAIRGNKLYWHKSGNDWKETENIDNQKETGAVPLFPKINISRVFK